ncbi:hypothetical protein QO010_000704 [Caulobacter ginsengisoli]|uniref:Uncharacterized protein n=1 Tax=Caulobacter ginsengisoli TaxID=400775 RepID=A0ABU0ILQ7_9CAUL|nr:hypothetical protein [Caulobacter ginsengisoli]MDQ0462956.1 hypothetical protein [Caulobacter ginsengisoli]
MGERSGGGLLAFLFDELASAIQDVRQKAVEEGWFGRTVTAAPVIDVERGALGHRPSFEEEWAPRQQAGEPQLEQGGHDLDR